MFPNESDENQIHLDGEIAERLDENPLDHMRSADKEEIRFFYYDHGNYHNPKKIFFLDEWNLLDLEKNNCYQFDQNEIESNEHGSNNVELEEIIDDWNENHNQFNEKILINMDQIHMKKNLNQDQILVIQLFFSILLRFPLDIICRLDDDHSNVSLLFF